MAPGAHGLIAMVAAAANQLTGREQRAQFWADDTRRLLPGVTRTDFFEAFPIRDAHQRQRMAAALVRLGFEGKIP